MKRLMEKLEHLLELGGIRKNVTLLVISGAAIICSLLSFRPFPAGAGYAHRYHGGYLQRHEARLPHAGGRRAGTVGRGEGDRL